MFKKISTLIFTGALLFVGTSNALAHEVESGDTMYKIAVSNNISLEEIAKLNPQVSNLNLIFVGETIKTNSNEKQVQKVESKPVKVSSNATSYEHDLLARIVRAEAQGESYNGKVAVATVVLNRVASQQFPNTIKEVIYQKGQFSPVTNGAINQKADSESIKAVQDALNGTSVIGSDVLFFYNSSTASSRWLDSKPTKAVIGNHTFK